MKMGASAGGCGPGCKGRADDLSSFAARLDELERDRGEELQNAMQAYERVMEAIKSVGDEREQDVLFYRYIKRMPWWKIAEEMDYSERQIHRLHGKGLAHLETLNDVIECQ